MSIEEEAKKFMSDKEKQADQINGLTCRQEVALKLAVALCNSSGYIGATTLIKESLEAADILLKDNHLE